MFLPKVNSDSILHWICVCLSKIFSLHVCINPHADSLSSVVGKFSGSVTDEEAGVWGDGPTHPRSPSRVGAARSRSCEVLNSPWGHLSARFVLSQRLMCRI